MVIDLKYLKTFPFAKYRAEVTPSHACIDYFVSKSDLQKNNCFRFLLCTRFSHKSCSTDNAAHVLQHKMDSEMNETNFILRILH